MSKKMIAIKLMWTTSGVWVTTLIDVNYISIFIRCLVIMIYLDFNPTLVNRNLAS